MAEVARPHGLRGELRLRVYNPDSDLLLTVATVRLVLPDGAARAWAVEAARPVPGAVLVKLVGVADRNAAEALRGAAVEVPRSALSAAGDDEHFVCDLIGCEVKLRGQLLGRVKTVADYPTCDALVVTRPGQPDLEVPMQQSYVAAIDTDERLVELWTIDGLEG